MMDSEVLRTLAERYPFITFFKYSGIEYVGVVQNCDQTLTTIYDFGAIQDNEAKKLFLDLANIWWWESNRSIPINIFLKGEWDVFKPYLKTFINKDLTIIHGPSTSLADLNKRKSKRKSITLVRKMD